MMPPRRHAILRLRAHMRAAAAPSELFYAMR